MGKFKARAVRPPKGRDGGWYWRIELKGQKKQVWSGWGTKPQIEALVSKYLVQIAEGIPVADTSDVMTVCDLMEVFNGYVAGRPVKPQSKVIIANASKRLIAIIGAVSLEDLDADHLHLFVNARVAEGFSGVTAKRDVKFVKQAWAWGLKQRPRLVPDRVLDSPVVGDQETTNNHYTPTMEEAEAVLAKITIPWRRMAFLLLLHTGVRIGTIACLRWEQVDFRMNEIRWDIWKGKKHITPTIDADLRKELLKHKLRTGGSGKARVLNEASLLTVTKFRSLEGKHIERAGVPEFNNQALRRLMVNDLLDNGVDPKTACTITGHSLKVMLEHYRNPRRQARIAAMERIQNLRRKKKAE
jgi:integrase